jgi:hypothetical protein
VVVHEQISPELALIDPDLAARARAALPMPNLERPLVTRAARPAAPSASPAETSDRGGHRPYPIWARVTAALWLLVLGILIGGAAIPHAQDAPRVIPAAEDPARLCEVPTPSPSTPTIPDVGSPLRPGGPQAR